MFSPPMMRRGGACRRSQSALGPRLKMPKPRFCVPVRLGSGFGTATLLLIVTGLLPECFLVGGGA